MSDFKNFYDLVAPQVYEANYQVSLLKEAILYQIFADKLHCLVIGHPSVGGKSFFRKSLELVCPSFDYAFVKGWTTKIGIGETALRVGEGLLMLDEVHKLSTSDMAILYDLLQFQVIKISKFGTNELLSAPVNVIGMGNPKPHGYWNAYGNVQLMRKQLPVDMALLRRFHINIFLRDYSDNEFDSVNKFKETSHNPFVPKDDAIWFQNEVVERRQLSPIGKVPENIFNFLKNMKKFENDIVTPVTSELFDGIIQVATARARIEKSEQIKKSDWDKTLEFYVKCLRTSGLTNRLIEKKLLK